MKVARRRGGGVVDLGRDDREVQMTGGGMSQGIWSGEGGWGRTSEWGMWRAENVRETV